MNTIRRSNKSIREAISFNLKMGIPFIYEYHHGTITIKTKSCIATSRDSKYSTDELNFIKKVKRAVKSSENLSSARRMYENQSSGAIKYFWYNEKIKPNSELSDCLNIDLNSAYWATAFKLGLISEALYKEGLDESKIKKQTRLTAIGSLAKKVKVYEFDGREQRKIEDRIVEETAFVWDVICNEVGKVLHEAAKKSGKDFIFFWVDGIYIKKSSRKVVESVFSNHGYDYKIIDCKKITTTDKNILVHCDKRMNKNGNPKEYIQFPFRSGDKAKKFSGYNRGL